MRLERFTEETGLEAPKCAFCGGRANAEWHGETTVAVCVGCATGQPLAALVADAIADHFATRLMAQGAGTYLGRFHLEFYRALALAYEQELSGRKHENEK